jgi:hypothetical protein
MRSRFIHEATDRNPANIPTNLGVNGTEPLAHDRAAEPIAIEDLAEVISGQYARARTRASWGLTRMTGNDGLFSEAGMLTNRRASEIN